jgi:hypothetical protein
MFSERSRAWIPGRFFPPELALNQISLLFAAAFRHLSLCGKVKLYEN